MKKLIFILFLITGYVQLILNDSNSEFYQKEITLESLTLLNTLYGSEGTGNCVADDPGECTATASCPGGGNSVCCVGNSPDCESGGEGTDRPWVECDNAGKSYANC